jgi:hypothetical protein
MKKELLFTVKIFVSVSNGYFFKYLINKYLCDFRKMEGCARVVKEWHSGCLPGYHYHVAPAYIKLSIITYI